VCYRGRLHSGDFFANWLLRRFQSVDSDSLLYATKGQMLSCTKTILRFNGKRFRIFEAVFLYSASIILLTTSAAKLISATGTHGILTERDPLLGLSNRQVLFASAGVEAIIVCVLLTKAAVRYKLLLLSWFASCLFAYRLGIFWLSPSRPCHCLGTLADRLPLSPASVDLLLKGIIGYLLFGSICLLVAGRCWRPASAGNTQPPV
jgi:hypothetical protein